MKYDLEATIAFKTTNTNELLSYLNENPIDVLVLDINLNSKLNGIEIANKLRKEHKKCYIIFTTAHSEYVFLAYKCKTFDFLSTVSDYDFFERTAVKAKFFFDNLQRAWQIEFFKAYAPIEATFSDCAYTVRNVKSFKGFTAVKHRLTYTGEIFGQIHYFQTTAFRKAAVINSGKRT